MQTGEDHPLPSAALEKKADSRPSPSSAPLDFDSGIQTSAAWTEHIAIESEHAHERSLSDEETEKEGVKTLSRRTAKRAIALYDFEGKPEFGEITLHAGDDLLVLREDAGDGWSLVDRRGEVGLLPRSYYSISGNGANKSRLSITPKNSPRSSEADPSILEPQTTGTYFPSFKESLLGGRALNRFASFVTSGAEDWILNSYDDTKLDAELHSRIQSTAVDNEEDTPTPDALKDVYHYHIDPGPSWRKKIPVFRIMVHSPYKKTALSGSYTVYQVTSVFYPSDESYTEGEPPSRTVTVHRRFSHFITLHTVLARSLPGIALPPLPGKQYAGRFNEEFVEARRADLERYLSRIVRHPIVPSMEIMTHFLSCDNEHVWQKMMAKHLKMPSAGASFYAKVHHPTFDFDAEDATATVERFSNHIRSLDKSVQWLRSVFSKVRDVRAEESACYKLLSYSLLSLITSTPLDSGENAAYGLESDESDDIPLSQSNAGLVNKEGAWCWRDNCEECLSLTKALQRTAEYLQHIGDLYDKSARERQFQLHDQIKDLAHTRSLYGNVIDIHDATLGRYRSRSESQDESAIRCETVLNTTIAEFDVYHNQKVEDFQSIAAGYLDSEIELQEQTLVRLKAARELFSNKSLHRMASGGPRQPSIYEKDLGTSKPLLSRTPIPQPVPHVHDSVPMRPVSAAVNEGIGLIFGNSATGRTSVFSRFW